MRQGISIHGSDRNLRRCYTTSCRLPRKRSFQSIMAGGAVGGAIAAVAGVKGYAPHGGPIVPLIIDEKIWFVIAIIVAYYGYCYFM